MGGVSDEWRSFWKGLRGLWVGFRWVGGSEESFGQLRGSQVSLGGVPVVPNPPLVPPQVSWSLEHRQAQSGTYEVKFFDEESYSALRKVGTPPQILGGSQDPP